MLNRRHIRIKVMQVLHASKKQTQTDFNIESKFLLASINDMYSLYMLLVDMLIEVQHKAKNYLIKSQHKHLATQEDKNPNTKFIQNQVLQQLVNNTAFQDKLETLKLNNWQTDNEYVDIIFKAIIQSDLYKNYMDSNINSFKEDKEFIVNIYKTIIAPNEKLYDYFEDQNITWINDFPIINTTIVKLLKGVKQDSTSYHFLPKLYKNEDDKIFALNLLENTLLNQEQLHQEIDSRTQNWETDRIAKIDYTLLQMAIAEILYFPTIPEKVTINEYIEIAKEFSTPKSSIFINGLLDNFAKEQKSL